MTQGNFLEARIAGFLEIRNQLERTFYYLEEADFQRKAQPKGWTVLQHLAHCNAVNFIYLKQLQQLPESHHKGNNQTVKHTLLGKWMFKALAMHPDGTPQMKLPAPKKLQPLSVQNPKTVLKERVILADFIADLQQFEKIAAAARNWDGQKIKLATALGKWPKINLLDALLVAELHTRRHLLAAERALKITV